MHWLYTLLIGITLIFSSIGSYATDGAHAPVKYTRLDLKALATLKQSKLGTFSPAEKNRFLRIIARNADSQVAIDAAQNLMSAGAQAFMREFNQELAPIECAAQNKNSVYGAKMMDVLINRAFVYHAEIKPEVLKGALALLLSNESRGSFSQLKTGAKIIRLLGREEAGISPASSPSNAADLVLNAS